MSRFGQFSLLIAGVLGGACAGVLATLHFTQKPAEPHHEVRYSQEPNYDPEPEQMLYPEGTTLEDLYPDEGLREAIRNPDSIRIHQIGGDGKIRVEEFLFSSKGVQPSRETSARLIRALCSLSSYEPPGKLCGFDPGVLLRLEKEGKSYDLMFCFSCRQIGASVRGRADMSVQGCKTFLKCFCDTLPDFSELHDARKSL